MSMFSKLSAAGLKAEFTTGGQAIQDQELDPRLRPLNGEPGSPFALEALFFGVSRRLIEGGPSPDPMEVWHLFTEGRQGSLVPRTIRGRSELATTLRFQAAEWGLAFLNCETGALEQAPTGEGRWILVRAADTSKVLMLARLGIDPKRGRMAGQGRGYAYNVACQGVAVAQARVAYPELVSLPMDAMLALPLEDEPAGTLTDSAPAPRESVTVAADDAASFEPKELVTTATPAASSSTRKRASK